MIRATPFELRALAGSCEAARVMSLQLDREIYESCCLPDTWAGSKVLNWFGQGPYGCNTEDGFRHLDCLNAPRFTASLDAASTLLPPGAFWVAAFGRTRPDEPLGAARVFQRGQTYPCAEAEAATPALALAAAALKALAFHAEIDAVMAGRDSPTGVQ